MGKQRTWKHWDDTQRTQLRALAGKLSTEEIAMTMGRSMQSVRMEAEKLGLSLRYQKSDRTNKRWSKQEESFLELKAGEMPAKLIAKHLHRSIDSVYLRASKLNLSLRIESDNWPVNNLANLLGVHRRTAWHWVESKKLKSDQVKKRYRYVITREYFREFYNQYRDVLPSLKNINPDALEFVLNG